MILLNGFLPPRRSVPTPGEAELVRRLNRAKAILAGLEPWCLDARV
jgi:hypothetical protein